MSTLHALRQATASLHRHLDKRPVFVRLLARQLTLNEYSHLLRVYHSLYAPLEGRLYSRADLVRLLPDLPLRRKAGHIAHDLAALGCRLSDLGSGAVTTPWPPHTTRCEALGCLYVLEGSTLGGRVLYQIVRETLGIQGDAGLTFLASYGGLIDERWRVFTRVVESLALTSRELEEAKRGAVGTFHSFVAAIDGMESHDGRRGFQCSDSQLRERADPHSG